MEEELSRDEMIKYEIDYYVNHNRIKNAENGTNKEHLRLFIFV